MNKLLLVLLATIFVISPAIAEKPAWAGKGKPTAEQKNVHKAAMNEKLDDDLEDNKQKIKKDKTEKMKGLEKQRQKKSDQIQNELDKGSDKGQQSREQRKKWWKFWDE